MEAGNHTSLKHGRRMDAEIARSRDSDRTAKPQRAWAGGEHPGRRSDAGCRAEAMWAGQRRRPNRAAPDGPQRPARRPQGEAARRARRHASARGGEPSGPLRKASRSRCAAKQALRPWPVVANAGGTARRGCTRGWDREREEATAASTPPSLRAPRDRREGAPARGPAFAIPDTVARAGKRTAAPGMRRPPILRRKGRAGSSDASRAALEVA